MPSAFTSCETFYLRETQEIVTLNEENAASIPVNSVLLAAMFVTYYRSEKHLGEKLIMKGRQG